MSEASVPIEQKASQNSERSVPKPGVIRERVRKFYAAAAVLMLVFMFAGFWQFFLKGMAYPGRPLTPPIRSLLIFHGLAMALWVTLLIVQSMLIVRKKPMRHMKLGIFGAWLSLVIFLSGLFLSVRAMQVVPPGMLIWGMTAKQFLVVPFFSILLFGAMVGFALKHRKRAEIHRPMMLFATLNALGAASGRVDAFNVFYQDTPLVNVFGPNLLMLLVGALLVVVHRFVNRAFDKWFAISYGVVLAVSVGMIQIAHTSVWARFADMLIG